MGTHVRNGGLLLFSELLNGLLVVSQIELCSDEDPWNVGVNCLLQMNSHLKVSKDDIDLSSLLCTPLMRPSNGTPNSFFIWRLNFWASPTRTLKRLTLSISASLILLLRTVFPEGGHIHLASSSTGKSGRDRAKISIASMLTQAVRSWPPIVVV